MSNKNSEGNTNIHVIANPDFWDEAIFKRLPRRPTKGTPRNDYAFRVRQ